MLTQGRLLSVNGHDRDSHRKTTPETVRGLKEAGLFVASARSELLYSARYHGHRIANIDGVTERPTSSPKLTRVVEIERHVPAIGVGATDWTSSNSKGVKFKSAETRVSSHFLEDLQIVKRRLFLPLGDN
jgi:hypothetical protein